jgi:glycosyltransferase involved in cell wall biosynthesis
MKPVLSIAIPTYNNASCLPECLASIRRSMQGFEDRVEVLVLDNASTDNTAEIVKSFQHDWPALIYHRNPENIGGARNFWACADRSSGEYIWIFGDDALEAEAIPAVFSKLDEGADVVVCNFSLWDSTLSHCVSPRFKRLDADVELNDPVELLKRFSVTMTLTSTTVVRKSIYMHIGEAEFLSAKGAIFPHIYAIFCGLPAGGRAYIIAKPLVRYRQGNSIVEGGNWDRAFLKQWALILGNLREKGYSAGAVRGGRNLMLREHVLMSLAVRKRDGISCREAFALLWQYYRDCWLFWMACLPILLTPGFVFRIAHKLLKLKRYCLGRR